MKSFLRFTFGAIAWLVVVPGLASTLENRYLAKVREAHSVAEVTKLSKDYSALKESRTACRIQLRRNMPPTACYESLSREAALGFYPSVKIQNDLRKRLDDRCAQSAAQIYLQPGLKPDLKAVSLTCALKLREASQIRDYRRQNQGDWSEN